MGIERGQEIDVGRTAAQGEKSLDEEEHRSRDPFLGCSPCTLLDLTGSPASKLRNLEFVRRSYILCRLL